MKRFKFTKFKKGKTLLYIIAFCLGLIITLSIGYAVTPEFDSKYVNYNNTNSHMNSTDVNSAIDELDELCTKGCPVGKECYDYTDQTNMFYEKFAVNGYRKVKFIDTFRGQSAYIDTGIPADYDVGIYIDVTVREQNGYIWGAAAVSSGTDPSYFAQSINNTYVGSSTHAYNSSDEERYFHNYYNSGYSDINGNRNYSLYNGDYTPNTSLPIYIAAINRNGTPGNFSSLRIFDVVITKGSSIVRKYTPCINTNNTPGFCEEITGTFIYRADGDSNKRFYAGPLSNDRSTDRFKVGDYLRMTSKWDKPVNLDPDIDTGCSSQVAHTCIPTFGGNSCSNINNWVVINFNPDRTFDAVMTTTAEYEDQFCGTTGYKNFIDALNNIASKYVDPIYVVRTRAMGYGDSTVMDNSHRYQPVTLDTSGSGNTWYNNGTCESQYMTSTGNDIDYAFDSLSLSNSVLKGLVDNGYGDVAYKRDIQLVENALGTAAVGNTDYFLASRWYKRISATDCYYGIRSYLSSENSTATQPVLWETTSHTITAGQTYEMKVRPITTFKSSVIPLSGSGTSADPYIVN